jgi:microcystin-dependent protein
MKTRAGDVGAKIHPHMKKWGLRLGIVGALMVAAGAVAYAGGLVTWSAGQTLTAADLNTNFSYLQGQITQLQQQGVPPGTIAAFAGPVVPSGWLLCDGAPVSRTTYASLFAAIGTVHGNGDGASTFNLPDYRGMFLRGVDGDAGRDPDKAMRTAVAQGANVGDEVGSMESSATALPHTAFGTSTAGSHTHTIAGGGYNSGGGQVGTFPGGTPFALNQIVAQAAGDHNHTVNTGGDSETRPVNAYVNYIVKY